MKKLPPKLDKLRNNVKGSKGYSWELASLIWEPRPVVKKVKE